MATSYLGIEYTLDSDGKWYRTENPMEARAVALTCLEEGWVLASSVSYASDGKTRLLDTFIKRD